MDCYNYVHSNKIQLKRLKNLQKELSDIINMMEDQEDKEKPYTNNELLIEITKDKNIKGTNMENCRILSN